MAKPTEIKTLIDDLDGGTISNALAQILSDVASAVDTHEKEGHVQLTLKMKKVSAGQIMIAAKTSFKEPTKYGERSEHNEKKTPFHITNEGITFFPPNQTQMFTRNGEAN